jgi:hypothetical protein
MDFPCRSGTLPFSSCAGRRPQGVGLALPRRRRRAGSVWLVRSSPEFRPCCSGCCPEPRRCRRGRGGAADQLGLLARHGAQSLDGPDQCRGHAGGAAPDHQKIHFVVPTRIVARCRQARLIPPSVEDKNIAGYLVCLLISVLPGQSVPMQPWLMRAISPLINSSLPPTLQRFPVILDHSVIQYDRKRHRF